VGVPKPEDGQPLPYWKARRAIRNIVWMVGGLVIVYLLALALHQSRENHDLVQKLEQQALADRKATIDSLANLLVIVKSVEERSEQAGVDPDVTLEEATEVLKETFPPELVDEAVKRAVANSTTTTTRVSTTTTRATTTTTAAAGPPGPQGPPGPPGSDAGGPGTSTTTTTTTMRPCTLGLNVPGLTRLCLLGG
jgi:hypothetical protein